MYLVPYEQRVNKFVMNHDRIINHILGNPSRHFSKYYLYIYTHIHIYSQNHLVIAYNDYVKFMGFNSTIGMLNFLRYCFSFILMFVRDFNAPSPKFLTRK